jgi:hypothetical protein
VGVDAEVRMAGSGAWYVVATTDILAAGREELRDAIAKVVKAAAAMGWVNREKAERWLRKLERGAHDKGGPAQVQRGIDRLHAGGQISVHKPPQHRAGGPAA